MYKRFVVTFRSGIKREFLSTDADVRGEAAFYAPSFGSVVKVETVKG